MKIIVLSGTTAALPGLDLLMGTTHLSALICPSETEPGELNALRHWAEEHQLPFWETEQNAMKKELTELVNETVPDLILGFGTPVHLPAAQMGAVRHGGWNLDLQLLSPDQGTVILRPLSDEEDAGEAGLHYQVQLETGPEAGSPFSQLSYYALVLLQALVPGLGNSTTDNLLRRN